LIRKDGSRKQAYEELLKLVKGEWWISPTKLMTDQSGQLNFAGFLGDYRLNCDGKTQLFSVNKPGPLTSEIRL